jgi:ribosomal-protein-alanine N-acetyltransferase
MTQKIFETKRLIVRPWTLNDAEDMFEYAGCKKTTEYMPWCTHADVLGSLEIIKMFIADYEKPYGHKSFAIELLDSGKVIGSVGYTKTSEEAGGIADIGYILNEKFQHKGYMTETVLGILSYIKQSKIAMRIQARFDVENTASGAVMKRCGMTFEGVARKSHDNNKHKRADMVWYSILAEEIK